MERVEIAAGRIQLRPWHEGDLSVIGHALTDGEISRWRAPGGTRDPRERLERSLRDWEEGTAASFAVMDAVSGEVHGSVDVFGIDHTFSCAQVGYWLVSGARGHGYATQALATASRWAFGALGLHRLTLRHAVVNAASCAVASRSGFTLEGTLRDAFPTPDGGFEDEHVHARLVTDPPPH